MKIAAVTEDGRTISQHFGRAPYYVVLTVEKGQIISREMRDKMGHAQFSSEPQADEHEHTGEDPRGHGWDPAAQDRHFRMAQAIRDCDVLLVRGMGSGAYYSMQQAGIRPIVTDIASIEEAALAAENGTIMDHNEYLH